MKSASNRQVATFGHDFRHYRLIRASFSRMIACALRRILAAGESTVMHTHELQGVGVPVRGGRLEVSDTEGTVFTIDVKTGAVNWIESGITHQLTNVGNEAMELVDIELK
jgi:mannose-6-phosphate isomerase-like protein (cupin superfamily)